jgi:hypothetical protein
MGDSLNKLHKWGRKDIRRLRGLRRYGNCETNPTGIHFPWCAFVVIRKLPNEPNQRIWRFLYSSVQEEEEHGGTRPTVFTKRTHRSARSSESRVQSYEITKRTQLETRNPKPESALENYQTNPTPHGFQISRFQISD